MPLGQNETSEIPRWLCLGDSSFQEICLLTCKKRRIKNNCCKSDPVVKIFDGGYIAIPNVFTLNNNGISDVLRVYHQGITSFQMAIKTKIGQTLFKTNNIDDFWNGTHNKKLKAGLHKVFVEITTEKGAVLKIESEICVFYSNKHAECLDNWNNCAFPHQWNDSLLIFETPNEVFDIGLTCN